MGGKLRLASPATAAVVPRYRSDLRHNKCCTETDRWGRRFGARVWVSAVSCTGQGHAVDLDRLRQRRQAQLPLGDATDRVQRFEEVPSADGRPDRLRTWIPATHRHWFILSSNGAGLESFALYVTNWTLDVTTQADRCVIGSGGDRAVPFSALDAE
jgi:hypothetical protein